MKTRSMIPLEQPPTVYTGVNIVGDLYAKLGLSEAARALATSMRHVGIPLAYPELIHESEHFLPDEYPAFQSLPRDYLYPINLMTHAITLVSQMSEQEFKNYTQGLYTIGYWFWELDMFPAEYIKLFNQTDEIWVSSHFIKQAIQKYCNTTVNVIPIPIEFVVPSVIQRPRFHLPKDRYIFLFSFSAFSSIARKNPFGVVKAFEIAFADMGRNRPLLVIKSTYMKYFPNAKRELEQALARVGGVLIDENLSREATYELIACSDAYVSLHRAEGFGMGMAEAMYLGKPVIGTNYSANVDFMNETNSYLVDFEIRDIAEADHQDQPSFGEIYPPGYKWAEPSIEHAAQQMCYLYEHQVEGLEKGRIAQNHLQSHYSYEAVGQQIKQRLYPIEQDITRRNGINIIGDLYTNIGISQAARQLTGAIVEQAINTSYIEKVHDFSTERIPPVPLYNQLPNRSKYAVNLIVRNILEMQSLSEADLLGLTKGKYTIAYWFWELEQLPESFIPQSHRVDEIWVASNHVKKAFEHVTTAPIKVIPVPLEVASGNILERNVLGLPEDRFIFLFSFSALSGIGRKNPQGVIEAFYRAFGYPEESGPLLVIKAGGLNIYPELKVALEEYLARVGGILIDQTMGRREMDSLLANVDAYVSLHRAEGFGLGMAEAMYLGKPVIATNYSSNTDFMNKENSFLVDYSLRYIVEEDHRFDPVLAPYFQPGKMQWAEPDIDHAAQLMCYLYENQDAGLEIGKKAAKSIQAHFSKEAVGKLVLECLREIQASPKVQKINRKMNISTQLPLEDYSSEIKNLLAQWCHLSVTPDKAAFHNWFLRIPLFKFIYRTLDRIRKIGQVRAAQSKLDQRLTQQMAEMDRILIELTEMTKNFNWDE